MSAAQVGIAGCMVQALATEGVELAEDDTLEVTFEPVAMVSLAEKYAAAAQAKTAGVPTKSILRNVLGWSPQQVSQADIDAASEVFTTSVRETITNPAPPKVTPNAPAA